MTEWGPEIDVNGARPEWLGENQEIHFHWVDGSHGDWIARDFNGREWRECRALQLPASHPYYLATSKGFTYWPGGNDAPCDWDGDPVLYKCGAVQGEGDAARWSAVSWEAFDQDSQIIGYNRKSTPVIPTPSGADGGSYYDVVINGHHVSCNDVIDALGLSFNHGELFKAAWRLGRKPGVPAKYDLDKIIYFANREAAKCQ